MRLAIAPAVARDDGVTEAAAVVGGFLATSDVPLPSSGDWVFSPLTGECFSHL